MCYLTKFFNKDAKKEKRPFKRHLTNTMIKKELYIQLGILYECANYSNCVNRVIETLTLILHFDIEQSVSDNLKRSLLGETNST